MLGAADKRLLLGERVEAVVPRFRPSRSDAPALAHFGASVTASASANTKGSWAELDAATGIDADGFHVVCKAITTGRDYLVDIGIGGAGSEVEIVSNLLVCSGVAFREFVEFFIPLGIPAGTRVAARCQASAGSAALHVLLTLAAGEHLAAIKRRKATTYGADTSDSGGVVVDPGAVASTYGSWAEISAATSDPITYAIICHGNRTNTARTAATALLDLGVGGAGSEVVVAPNMGWVADATNDVLRPNARERWLNVPAGSRLAARAMCEITDATDRLSDVVVIGFS